MATYRPRDPRAKLREVTTHWTLSMRIAGRAPNCGVVFGRDAPLHRDAQAHAWLVGDRRPETRGDSYVILEDGDVWRARGSGTSTSQAASSWLTEPDDDLVGLLARSLGDARLGGAGWLEMAAKAQHVDDRRTERLGHAGPERRG